ncbi:MAG TPA: hypothetical protein VGN54_00555 [Mycobacteriales bacterium]|jgi:cell division septum initiation protein DivIVA|nr:hypothetical protein [Mycobacteriales bacterium]
MADLHSKLDELTDLVHGAKPMPLSASCVVNRAELLAALDEIRQLLPGEIAAASGVLQDKAGVVDEGRSEAQRIIADATAERDRLVSRDEVAAEARRQAEALLAEAREQADTMRVEVEDYVDGKLANFEVVLHKTIAAVERGRERLRGRHDDGLAGDAPLDPVPLTQ